MYYDSRPELLYKSAPIKVVFQGWESTTAQLASYGWDIAVTQDIDYRHLGGSMRMMIGNRNLELYGVSDHFRLDMAQRDPRLERTSMNHMQPIIINRIVPNMHIERTPIDLDVRILREVDAIPEMVPTEVTDLADYDFFKWKDQQGREQVIVEQADLSVIEHLEEIVKLQAPKQKELRKKIAKEEVRKKDNVVELIQVAK